MQDIKTYDKRYIYNVYDLLKERRHHNISKPILLDIKNKEYILGYIITSEYDQYEVFKLPEIQKQLTNHGTTTIKHITLYILTTCNKPIGKVIITEMLNTLTVNFNFKKESQLLIICNNITNQAIYLLQAKLEIDSFTVISHNDISIPRTRHKLVPQYTVLNEKETIVIEKKYNSSRLNFPKIVVPLDPIARYLGFKPGQVVQIMRRCNQNGFEIIYRYVINA